MVNNDGDHRKNGPWVIEAEHGPARNVDDAVDYEKAICSTGYGLYNVMLLLAAIPAGWTAIFDTTSAAFILPAVECVFELTIFRKGVLVSIVYIGMIVIGPFWDFGWRDFVTDRLGKRNTILLGLFIDSICNILWIHVSSYYLFLLLKFISGVICGGPLSVLMTHLTEFHAPKYQPNFAKWGGLLFAVANVIPAALAFNVLPYYSPFTFKLFDRFYGTWRVYLLICAIPPVLGVFTTFLVPESPKYLLSQGQQKEALRLLQRMYTMNTGKSRDSFPIKALLPLPRVQSSSRADIGKKMQEALIKTKKLFSSPYLLPFSIIAILQFGAMLGFNTMRLWVPQLFIMLNNFKRFYSPFYPKNVTLTMCEMLIPQIPRVTAHNQTVTDCNPSYIDPAVYINSTIIAASAVSFGFLFGFFTNTATRKKIVLVMVFLLSIASSFATNWSQAVPIMLTLCAAVIVTSRIASNIVMGVNVDVISAPLRPAATNILNLIGNIGAVVGNFAFSALLGPQCLIAFLGIGCLTIVCCLLSLFLPKPVPADAIPNARRNKF